MHFNIPQCILVAQQRVLPSNPTIFSVMLLQENMYYE